MTMTLVIQEEDKTDIENARNLIEKLGGEFTSDLEATLEDTKETRRALAMFDIKKMSIEESN